MFDGAINMPLICSANQLTGFYLIQYFTEKCFPRGYGNLHFNFNNSTQYI